MNKIKPKEKMFQSLKSLERHLLDGKHLGRSSLAYPIMEEEFLLQSCQWYNSKGEVCNPPNYICIQDINRELALDGGELDTLYQLMVNGPLESGDMPSKSGFELLCLRGYAERELSDFRGYITIEGLKKFKSIRWAGATGEEILLDVWMKQYNKGRNQKQLVSLTHPYPSDEISKLSESELAILSKSLNTNPEEFEFVFAGESELIYPVPYLKGLTLEVPKGTVFDFSSLQGVLTEEEFSVLSSKEQAENVLNIAKQIVHKTKCNISMQGIRY